MAIKHLMTWGIGYNASGDYPLFLVTHGFSIGGAEAAAAAGPAGERLTATFAILKRHTADLTLVRRVTTTLTR